MPLLEVKNLTVNYGYISALRGVDFAVNEGEITALIGSNGAGKTTSLMAISGLVQKAAGQVIYAGEDITNLAPYNVARQGIAHVPEGRQIFPELSVQENLRTGAYTYDEKKKGGLAELYDYVYSLFPRLKERVSQIAGTLSGGEQQMLAIGRGLMMDPSLLILDEPSLGLAPIIVEEIFELIENIRATGKTILLVEQNAAMALDIADRAYVLENGSVIIEGTGQDLLDNEEVKSAYLGG